MQSDHLIAMFLSLLCSVRSPCVSAQDGGILAVYAHAVGHVAAYVVFSACLSTVLVLSRGSEKKTLPA